MEEMKDGFGDFKMYQNFFLPLKRLNHVHNILFNEF